MAKRPCVNCKSVTRDVPNLPEITVGAGDLLVLLGDGTATLNGEPVIPSNPYVGPRLQYEFTESASGVLRVIQYPDGITVAIGETTLIHEAM